MSVTADFFSFQTVNDIRCGANYIAELATLLQQKFLARKVLIVTDAGLVKLGKTEPLLLSLQQAGIDFKVFDHVLADPPESIVLQAAEFAVDVDVVIGFGGGSSMDTAKLVAALAMQEQSLASMFGVDKVHSRRKPLVQIPTTAGTGSEVTPIAVVTTGEATKSGVVSPVLYADLVILDPSLLLGMPKHITAETGVDAMVHAIEAYTSKIKKNPLSDLLAKQALQILNSALPLAYHDGQDIRHRQQSQLGAMLAGQAFANAPVAGVHALAYPLGGIFHLAHGLSNALMLPHLLHFNLSHATREYAELARSLLSRLPTDELSQAQCFIEHIEQLIKQLGLAKRLREFDIKEADLPRLATDAMQQTRLLQNNPRRIDYDDALALYRQAW
jgi:alcohol dehydrogenase